MASEPFPLRQVATIAPPDPARTWLIESLWLDEGTGVLGGAPKCMKTWIACELALAVASGQLAFGRFAVHRPGSVICFCAEDSQPVIRERFEALAAARDASLRDLPLHLLDVPALRLDRQDELERLEATVSQAKPRLLVLDPFVRLTRIDENSAQEVAQVLGGLRALQRRHQLAILLVHHARKSAGRSPAQAFRGSSDFAAWGDSNLYVTRHRDQLQLTLEHRRAAPPPPLSLQWVETPQPHFLLADACAPTSAVSNGLAEHLLGLLRDAPHPLSTNALRQQAHRRKADVVRALAELKAAGHLEKTSHGWRIRPNQPVPGSQP